jgi:hypothetical protein
MAKIKIKHNKIKYKLDVTKMYLEKELNSLYKKKEKFKNIAARNVMNAHNKKCLLKIFAWDIKRAKNELSHWQSWMNYGKYSNRVGDYNKQIKSIESKLGSTKRLLKTIEVAQDNGVQTIILDSTECVFITDMGYLVSELMIKEKREKQKGV